MNKLFLSSIGGEILDDIVKHLSKSPRELNLVFIPTASEVETGDLWWLKEDREKLIQLGFNVTEFSLTGLDYDRVKKKLKNIDVVFVSGGNTYYLLDQVIKSGFDRILKERGDDLIYIGVSAGASIMGRGIDIDKIDDPSKAPDLKSDGLGIVDLTILPHWGSEEFKEGYKESFEGIYNENYKIVPISNKQYILVEGDSSKIIQV